MEAARARSLTKEKPGLRCNKKRETLNIFLFLFLFFSSRGRSPGCKKRLDIEAEIDNKARVQLKGQSSKFFFSEESWGTRVNKSRKKQNRVDNDGKRGNEMVRKITENKNKVIHKSSILRQNEYTINPSQQSATVRIT